MCLCASLASWQLTACHLLFCLGSQLLNVQMKQPLQAPAAGRTVQCLCISFAVWRPASKQLLCCTSRRQALHCYVKHALYSVCDARLPRLVAWHQALAVRQSLLAWMPAASCLIIKPLQRHCVGCAAQHLCWGCCCQVSDRLLCIIRHLLSQVLNIQKPSSLQGP